MILALRGMPRIEISFNCAECGQRMDQLTDSGICSACDDPAISVSKRRIEQN
jgi:hypothetical protein